VEAMVKDYSLLGKVIYLDAGHGGVDSGAVSNTALEKEINLEIVDKLESELMARGALVLLTREGDYDLSTTSVNRKRDDLYSRVKLINDSNCDLYISIHLNSTTSNVWRGLQIFYSSVNDENKVLAEMVNKTLSKEIDNVREVKKSNEYYMYRNITRPGILIEAGFLSNYNDNYLLRQDEIFLKKNKYIVYL
jgi:N-acetylmuramoyl-L-alanine amidase